MGDGPPVILCHGFPESWFSWRYQIPALADAGFRVIAADMKGYGDSSAPAEMLKTIGDLVLFLVCILLYTYEQYCGLAQATLVGHDWGGALVWNMAQCHPERLRAVASLNTPLFPVDPNKDPMDKIKSIPIFEYQLYFQEPVSYILCKSIQIRFKFPELITCKVIQYCEGETSLFNFQTNWKFFMRFLRRLDSVIALHREGEKTESMTLASDLKNPQVFVHPSTVRRQLNTMGLKDV
uniref:Epoxide hydrolase 2, cytoplasmic n=1 Tax=Pygocentrus nattereri TaxID=42514 RepID=A0AAR2KKA9_PYGNA